jgi:hypothetical protein
MTAGVAAAEVTFSGTTQAAISNTTNAGNVLSTHIDFNVAVSAESSNGITMSTGFGYDAGRQVDAGDFELDANEAAASNITDDGNVANDTNNNPAWGTAAPNVVIGYNGFTLTADGEGVDDLYDDDFTSGDVAIAGSVGGVSFALTTAMTEGDNDSSMSVSYAMGDLTASYVSTNNAGGVAGTDASVLSVAYAMGDLTVDFSNDDDGVTAEAVQTVGFSYAMDAMTIAYSAANTGAAGSNIGDDWDASVSYSGGALTASVATDEDSIMELSGSYDLGGGANAFVVNRSGTNAAGADQAFTAMGINFAF